MVHVTRVDLTQRGVELPGDRVGMVLAQPHLCLTVNEPFTCLPNKKDQQFATLRKTLEVAAAGHRGIKTHFTIFPEYSIPGLGPVEIHREFITAAAR